MKTNWSCESIVLLLALICFLTFSGCSTLGGQSSSPPPNPVSQEQQTDTSTKPPPATATTSTTTTTLSAPQPLFYDFTDIPTPQELDLQSKESYVVQSGALKTGVLTLRGRVELNSLINFFQMAMLRENWKPKGYFRYHRSILIFEKPDKICVIRLYEDILYSYVEIFVTPASG